MVGRRTGLYYDLRAVLPRVELRAEDEAEGEKDIPFLFGRTQYPFIGHSYSARCYLIESISSKHARKSVLFLLEKSNKEGFFI